MVSQAVQLADTVRESLHTLYAYTSDDANPPALSVVSARAAKLEALVAKAVDILEDHEAFACCGGTFAIRKAGFVADAAALLVSAGRDEEPAS